MTMAYYENDAYPVELADGTKGAKVDTLKYEHDHREVPKEGDTVLVQDIFGRAEQVKLGMLLGKDTLYRYHQIAEPKQA